MNKRFFVVHGWLNKTVSNALRILILNFAYTYWYFLECKSMYIDKILLASVCFIQFSWYALIYELLSYFYTIFRFIQAVYTWVRFNSVRLVLSFLCAYVNIICTYVCMGNILIVYVTLDTYLCNNSIRKRKKNSINSHSAVQGLNWFWFVWKLL